jgi:hypothetical protein
MHWDSWNDDIPGTVPALPSWGHIAMIPKRRPGPWSPNFAQQTTYPEAKIWPPHELWFESRGTPPTNEFTVGNIATSAAAYGYLCDVAPKVSVLASGNKG